MPLFRRRQQRTKGVCETQIDAGVLRDAVQQTAFISVTWEEKI